MNPSSGDFPKTIKIGILVFDDFEPIDVWGVIQAFSIARFIGTDYGTVTPVPFEIALIANQDSCAKDDSLPLVKSYNGPRVAADYFRNDALHCDFDMLMIPGGQGTRPILESLDKSVNAEPLQCDDELKALLDWVKLMNKKVSIMASVCTGAAILACTGLLDGKPAATNHHSFAWVTSFGPKVLWNNVSRWVDDGHYVTSAGVSAGTDLAFHLVSRLAGRAVAETAALAAEYDWHRDPNQPIFYPQQASVPSSLPSKK